MTLIFKNVKTTTLKIKYYNHVLSRTT